VQSANGRLVRNRQSSDPAFGNFPDQWGWMGAFQDASENHFNAAVGYIHAFEVEAKTSTDPIVNVRADDLVEIMDMLVSDKGILSEPYGRLTATNAEVEWSELDDRVYYAQGAAIVARDIAVALKHSFPTELSRGGLENLDAAIEALDDAARFNPWWVTRGEASSQFADHRAKMQRYFTEAFRRLEDLRRSIEA
jgi:hypothetical protein